MRGAVSLGASVKFCAVCSAQLLKRKNYRVIYKVGVHVEDALTMPYWTKGLNVSWKSVLLTFVIFLKQEIMVILWIDFNFPFNT